jgi:hypothetical protein
MASYTLNVALAAPPTGNVLIPAGAAVVNLSVDPVTSAAITTAANAAVAAAGPVLALDYSGASDQTAALNTALSATSHGAPVLVQLGSGVVQISGLVTIPPGAGLVGAGGNMHSGQIPTTLRCSTAAAGIQVLGCGPSVGDLTVDGANIATQPFLAGSNGTPPNPGGERLFRTLNVINSAGNGIVIQARQNDVWLNCQVSTCVGRGIVIDYGAGGILFARQEVNACAGSLLIQESGTAPTGAYTQPQHVTFLHSIFERQTSNTASAIQATAGDFIYFTDCITTGKDANDTASPIALSGSARVTITNCQLNSISSQANTSFLSLAGSSKLIVSGMNYLVGGASKPTWDVDAPSGTELQLLGDLRGANGNRAIIWSTGTPQDGDQTASQPLKTYLASVRTATSDNVIQTSLQGDTGMRFKLQANGALSWMDGTSFTGDTSLVRVAAGQLQSTAIIRPNADSTLDFGSASASLSWRTVNCRSLRSTYVPQTLAANGAVTIVPLNGDAAITLQANATSSSITTSASVVNGHLLTITWIQDATGGRTYAWPAVCKFAGGSAPSDTTANKRTSVTFRFDGTNWWEESRAVGVG